MPYPRIDENANHIYKKIYADDQEGQKKKGRLNDGEVIGPDGIQQETGHSRP
jgi:hypothetical protein